MNKKFLEFIAIVLVSTFAILCCVWVRYEAVRIGYTLQKQEKTIDELSQTNAQYKFEITRNASLERIEHVAREQFGMISPSEDQIVRMERP